MALADKPRQREKIYAEYVKSELPEDELLHIRQSLQRGQLTGSKRFIEEIEKALKGGWSAEGQVDQEK